VEHPRTKGREAPSCERGLHRRREASLHRPGEASLHGEARNPLLRARLAPTRRSVPARRGEKPRPASAACTERRGVPSRERT
jgi:hypothetical protein